MLPAEQIDHIRRIVARESNLLAANLLTGLRLALPIPANGRHLHPSLGQFVTLLFGLWMASAANDLFDAGTGAEFSLWGIASEAAYSYFWIATISIIVLIDRRPTEFLRLAVAMASVSVTLLIAWIITTNLWLESHPDSFLTHARTIWRVFLVWGLLVFGRVVLLLYRAPWRRALCYTVGYGAAVYAMLAYLPHRPIFIEPLRDRDQMRVDVEAAYYAQANLLGQSLYELPPQRPGVVDLYFVGFGAYADQDVFRREVEQAVLIFERQFGTRGRSVSLINNLDTLQSVPLANRHNLERAIRGVAKRIDLTEDVVVVFLSSHGAEDATIAVDLSGFGFNDLSANEVRKILDHSGIKWRIVIVSACYSGSFIEALASPTTLVITAASSDRSSFGCSHENEWTYFGEAYFEKGLKQAPSFISAFETARTAIARREAAEGKKASDPQISIGSEIGAYLTQQRL